VVTPTNTYALAQAIIAAIQAIVPRFEPLRSETWQYTPGDRQRGTALHLLGTPLRSFDLIFEPASRSDLWYGNGHSYSCRLRICTSYAQVNENGEASGLEPGLRDHMISADGVDLDRMFRQLTEPTVPGFAHAEYERTGQTYLDDRANAMVEHLFVLHYSQNTD
jgi:hypothetical protein